MNAMVSGNSDVLKLAALAGLGYVGYRYVYLPARVRADTEAQAALYRAQHPGASPDMISQAATVACQGFGLSYGLPPSGTSGLCRFAGLIESKILRNEAKFAVGLAKGTAKGAVGVGKALGHAGKSVAHFFGF